jgi:predicted dehydrogenase
MEKIRYGIIGLGRRGFALVDAALKTGEIEIVAAATENPWSAEKLRDLTAQVKIVNNYSQLLNFSNVDAVVIATPNFTHKDIVLAAISTGKHILCEKPAGVTEEEIIQIQEALKGKNLIFQVGTELRYSPMGQKLKEIVSAGAIGPLRMLWCREYRPPLNEGVNNWRVSSKSGGVFLEKSVHHFDLFCWLAESSPMAVHAFGGADVIYQRNGILDNGIVTVEFENKMRACLMLGLFHNNGFLMELGALGENGHVDTYTPPTRMEITAERYKAVYDFTHTPIVGGYNHDGEVEQHLAFVHSIRTGEKPLSGIDAVRPAHSIALAAQRSITEKRRITL